MQFLFTVGCMCLVLWHSQGFTQDDSRLKPITFRTPVKQLIIQPEHFIKDLEPNDILAITLPGLLHLPPTPIRLIQRQQAQWHTPLEALSADFSAWKANDHTWIQRNFVNTEQGELKSFLANQKLREWNNRDFTRKHSMALWGEIHLEQYRLLWVRYNQDQQGGTVITLVQTNQGWQRTNALANNEIYIVVASAVKQGEVSIDPQSLPN